MRVPAIEASPEDPSGIRIDVGHLDHCGVFWWRLNNGWTRCSPWHRHPNAEEAVACLADFQAQAVESVA